MANFYQLRSYAHSSLCSEKIGIELEISSNVTSCKEMYRAQVSLRNGH